MARMVCEKKSVREVEDNHFAFLALARVSPNGTITYRHPEVWQSQAYVLLEL